MAITYDTLGNPVIYKGNALTWTRGRLLNSYGTTKYYYDVNGIRQEKIVNGVKHEYYTEGERIHKEVYGSNTLWYYYDQTGVTAIDYNGIRYFFQKNLQGDIIRIYDTAGVCVARYVYDAWGNHKVYDASGVENTEATFIGNINPFRYRGYYYDTETGLYYLNSRYYDPQVRRFINADEITSLNTSGISGTNQYSYASNNAVAVKYKMPGYSSNGESKMVMAISSLNNVGLMVTSGIEINLPQFDMLGFSIDMLASMSGASKIAKWATNNNEFFDFWSSSYGITKNQALNSLSSTFSKIYTAISYGLILYEGYRDYKSNLNAGATRERAAAIGATTITTGFISTVLSAKIGAAIGGTIGGIPGFLIGTAIGVTAGVVIDFIFYFEINGKSIAGYIADIFETLFGWLS